MCVGGGVLEESMGAELLQCLATDFFIRAPCFPREVNTSRLLSLISSPPLPSPPSSSHTWGSVARERGGGG